MFRTRRRASLLALLVSFTLFAAACGDDDTSSADGGAGDPTDDGNADGAGGLPDCLTFADLYALTGPEAEGIGTWSGVQDVATELGSDTELPDLPLTIAGPGEESGTYDTFVELVIDPIAEERGVDAAVRPDYLSSPNDNVIVENLSGAQNSLGWVGYAFYDENADILSAFEVSDGEGPCTAPTPETIASGEYPLSRPLYIYVNNAKLAENGTLAEYVRLYLTDLYDCVNTADYIALTDDVLAETVSTLGSLEGSDGTDDGSQLAISGSSTVEPISQCVLQLSGFSGSVEGPGTGDGFKRFCAGETDISDASRAIKDAEAETCDAAGIEYTELQVAVDGIAIMSAA